MKINSGRPRKTTARGVRWIGSESKKNLFATGTTISKRANSSLGMKISRHTISWRLNEINLNDWVASMKPYISKKNKMSRLKFATEHIIWAEEPWHYVHFSDESKFNLFGCDRRRFIWCSPREWYSPQCTKSSIKFEGGSRMVFSAAGTGPLVRLHSRINATVYKEILKKHVIPNLRSAVFMQDNAPYHTAKSIKTFLSQEDVTVMEWPAQSPDKNPIENV